MPIERPTMTKLSVPEAASYAGAAASIGSSLTLTTWGVVAGIVTGLLTFAMNLVFSYRRDRREQRESEARLAVIEDGHHG
jgi:hypothetical protein